MATFRKERQHSIGNCGISVGNGDILQEMATFCRKRRYSVGNANIPPRMATFREESLEKL
jgi:hypothetical protein